MLDSSSQLAEMSCLKPTKPILKTVRDNFFLLRRVVSKTSEIGWTCGRQLLVVLAVLAISCRLHALLPGRDAVHPLGDSPTATSGLGLGKAYFVVGALSFSETPSFHPSRLLW
ncbi:hypothetical protein RRG08_064242 [Elysia crispata]|uniref:Uncharacterized protein n=1 Tax=Elysia crispata TaxID=231223 RepID=A0AAE0YES0_9GAST|nr:hypothetical protein RRG08_064242 [Elysia crispata]